jgi:hypothetical protein
VLRLIGSLAHGISQLIERDLETAAHRAVGNSQPARDLGAAETFDEVQQDGGPVRFREREHLVGNRALQLDALHELGRCRHRSLAIVRGVALAAPRLAPAAGVCELRHDAREPRPERPVGSGLVLRRDQPGVLRHVVGDGVILDEGTCELAHPAHLGHQLFAGWNPCVVHDRFHTLPAAAGANVRTIVIWRRSDRGSSPWSTPR